MIGSILSRQFYLLLAKIYTNIPENTITLRYILHSIQYVIAFATRMNIEVNIVCYEEGYEVLIQLHHLANAKLD